MVRLANNLFKEAKSTEKPKPKNNGSKRKTDPQSENPNGVGGAQRREPRTAEEGESEMEVPQSEREMNGGVGPNQIPKLSNAFVLLYGLSHRWWRTF